MNPLLAGSVAGMLLFSVIQASATTPVEKYGLLKVANGKLCSAQGEPVQLKGMSLFWSQWAGAWYNPSVVKNLADQWGCTVVRAAMGVEMGGYLTHPEAEKSHVRAVVDAAIAQGIYVIIDWHDHHAEQHLAQSRAFFKEMATDYKNVPDVLFEIYNEPMGASWATVKAYAEAVIDEIRGAGAENVVIVGTPTWSQDVQDAAADPINRPNIAYTLHFYAGTHKQSLRDRALKALARGIAIVVTEWGTCDASGNGGFSAAESEAWIKLLDDNKITWCNWSMFDKNETASALKPGSSVTGPWTAADLTQSGRFVMQHMSDAARALLNRHTPR